jgi:hypothetical protein
LVATNPTKGERNLMSIDANLLTKTLTTASLLAVLLTGCANIPDVTYRYYPAKASTTISVVQTIGCAPSKQRLVILTTPIVSTAYSSDYSKKPFAVRIKELERWSSDSEMAMTLTEDGRIKSINQSNTGQGEGIVKSAVSLVAAVAGMSKRDDADLSECKVVEDWGGGKPVTLTYRLTVDSANGPIRNALEISPDSADLYQLLAGQLPALEASVSASVPIQPSALHNPPANGVSHGVVLMEFQSTGYADVEIFSNRKKLGSAVVVVPLASRYQVPVPKAALFGKQSFAMSAAESGAVTSVSYGKSVGASGALNALGAIAGTQTASTKAAEVKAEADLIAQQQRLVTCQTKPADCK